MAELTELEREFEQSWVKMELFFARQIIPRGQNYLRQIYLLILFCQSSRDGRYCKNLRAGQSMDALVVSRSAKHGLRRDQPSVRISADLNGNVYINYYDGKNRHGDELVMQEIIDDILTVRQELIDVLEKLMQHPIE